jgi:hypothetical protein
MTLMPSRTAFVLPTRVQIAVLSILSRMSDESDNFFRMLSSFRLSTNSGPKSDSDFSVCNIESTSARDDPRRSQAAH